MKNILNLLLILIFITSVNAFSEGNKAAEEETAYFDFPLDIGNQWTYTYKTSDEKEPEKITIYIDSIFADEAEPDYPYFVLRAKEDKHRYTYVVMKNTNKHLIFTNELRGPILELLKYPLKISGNTNLDLMEGKLIFSVAELNEEIEVEAGKFNCLRIDLYFSNENMKVGSIWMSNYIGIIKFSGQFPGEDTNTIELTDYKIMGR